MLYVMIRLYINQNGMKYQDRRIYVRFSTTRQNRTHYIHHYNDFTSTNYKIYMI